MEINNAAAVAELAGFHASYERALIDNDVPALESMFWDSPLAIRYGATENLYGIDEIKAFRRGRPKVDLAREIQRLEITTFGDSHGVINLHFTRMIGTVTRHGRQTQLWVKLAEGWKIVSAHVSLMFQPVSYAAAVAERIALPVREEDREAVEEEMQRISSVAQVMLQFPLEQSVEAAPTFQP
jgi:hypothetical protein